MALKNLWEQERSQRLQITAERRQQVNQWKQLTQQELQLEADLLHQELSSSVTSLHHNRKLQQQQFQQEIVERQLEILQIKTDVCQRQQEYRQQRTAKAQTLFQDLQNFRAILHKSVWGDRTHEQVVAPPSAKTEKLVATVPKWSISRSGIKATGFRPSVNTMTRKVPESNADTKSKVQQYIQQAQGATLIEIEEVIGLTRVQTIDILRSLIKQGVLEQRDRQYFIRQQAIS
ncbi:MAG: gas vesicle protein GvpC [Nostoc sp. DedQUE08]|uniref:gas vesicle protein GvpC n=1 Tax=unclassified Nostoc TaxID=2593658 RepID=UPI002AD5AC06|nr:MULTISPECIES: gas vesicle protein GvpC [unclassified Nostoc]MDZ8068084.1 gas vesicle protein GvpC [Nostoc sp. DedQUE08]MDZ8095105.1 gas vesicle protein GvpC [Nostoc sp. DedQUE05]MDZ8128978.1 gas vesicle protein GvpC [Nostoc sp. DedQUE07]MDZ8139613.1 gas vesicle protein GvpC [Nostoc sp. DedQUE04]